MILSKIIWNPVEGIDLGFFVIRFYSLMFVIAFSLGWFLMKKIYIRESISIEKLDSIFIYAVIATLLGARLGHVFFYDWDHYKNNLLEILLPFRFRPEFEFTGFQGLASHGAAIGMIIAMYYYSKNVIQKHILWVLDRIVIPVAFGAIFVRLGNFFNSEIIGKASGDSAFGVKFVRDGVSKAQVIQETGIQNVNEAYSALVNNPKFSSLLDTIPYRHPAQLYEAFGYVFVAIILWVIYWKTDKRNNKGFLFGAFLVLLWTVRFLVEFVKKSQGGFEDALGESLSTGQWLSIPFILAGLYFIIRSGKKAST
ncbi:MULTISPECIES: prolipoprotein diacylglyceryl transferase [Aquimarina]|uniref:Phosphatidylglycerol--prolipoprotein diacylglyceryl transferase n=1 Tax=Aquimarina algiphila TaxID=2047982 RepID=A0A554VBI8_9FLAO|nr:MULTISPECIES: prolipoprotein diacylglyceryl transferase [Aquimarina]TSE03924.1 prolipoprotein diacylglyceryl transferase [Aquimarina algiphila]